MFRQSCSSKTIDILTIFHSKECDIYSMWNEVSMLEGPNADITAGIGYPI
jgi:hypothetical protein